MHLLIAALSLSHYKNNDASHAVLESVACILYKSILCCILVDLQSVPAMKKSVFLLCITISLASATVIYVNPNHPEGQCRGWTPCDTLSNYATANESYFRTSNMTFVFLPGLHLLEVNITFARVKDLTLTTTKDDGLVVERNETIIECASEKENIGFLFEEVSELSINGLMISRCSRTHYHTCMICNSTNIQAGLCFRNIRNLKMNAVSVQKSNGYGVFLSLIFGESWIESCIFQKNRAPDDPQMGGNAALVYQDCRKYHENASASVQIVGSEFLDGNSHMFASGLVLVLNCPKTRVNVSLVEATILNNSDSKAVTPRSCISPAHPSNGGNLAVIFNSGWNSIVNSIFTGVDSVGMNQVSIINSTISLGRACFGGGIFLHSTLSHNSFSIIIENSELSNNTASDGGGVYAQLYSYWENDRSSQARNNVLTMTACNFTGNQLLDNSNIVAGVALAFASSTRQPQFVILLSNCHVLENGAWGSPAGRGEGGQHPSSLVGAVLTTSVRIHMKNCIFEWNRATAISGFRSVLTFSDNVIISHNIGQNGGGIALREASYVTLTPHTTLSISYNHADSFGGGIYHVDDHYSRLNEPCFYQIDLDNDTSLSVREALEDTRVRLLNNTAYLAGSQLYGGRVDSCVFPYGTFDKLFEYQSENGSEDTSKISSDPEMIQFCAPHQQVNTYYGADFNVSLLLTGQRGGVTPGKVVFTTNSRGTKVFNHEKFKSSNGCVKYLVSVAGNRSNSVILNISIEQSTPFQLLTNDISLEVEIVPLPLGFVAINEDPFYECIKYPNLAHANFQCIISENKSYVKRTPPHWLGYDKQDGFSLYVDCPDDYCKTVNYTEIETNSEKFNQDEQCMNNRTGKLCGMCKNGLSLSFGSSACLDCTHTTFPKSVGISLGIALLAVVFLLIILALDINITRGTMSGYMLYANLFYIYWTILVPDYEHKEKWMFFKVMIYATNMAFSCEHCCLYDGFDVVGRTWVQFMLVVYIWSLAGGIIWMSRKFACINAHIGHVTVPILATVLLFSHISTSIAIIHALSFAVLKYTGPNGSTVSYNVMLFDGNVGYLKGRHIPLFIVGCIFAILSLGFTFTLLCVQPLQRYSHLKIFRWVNHLKPLIDAYTCPHIVKPRYRFWNGFLLLIRSIIYILTTTPQARKSYQSSLTILSVVCFIVILVPLVLGGVYTKRHLNYLSNFYIINLFLLSVIASRQLPSNPQRLYIHHQDTRRHSVFICSMVSLGTATTMFFCILGYHIYQLMRKLKVVRKLRSMCMRLKVRYDRAPVIHSDSESYERDGYCEIEDRLSASGISSTSSLLEFPSDPRQPPLSSTHYREPQLKDYDSM